MPGSPFAGTCARAGKSKRCTGILDHSTEDCCSSHRVNLCHPCYRYAHFVDACDCAHPFCVAERQVVPA